MRIRTVTSAVVALTLASALTACSGGASAGGTSAAGCAQASHIDTVHAGTLTVATYEAPPYVTFTGDKLGGVDGDILTGFAAKECLTIAAMPAAAAAVIPAVQSGRADIASGGWWRSTARAQIVALTDPIYTDQMVLMSKAGFTTMNELKGKKVGTVNGNIWVNDAKNYLGGDLQLYRSPLDLYQDLKSGRLDAAIDGYGEAKSNSNGTKVEVMKPDSAIKASLEPPQTCFPVPKGNTALLTALNSYIASLRKDGELTKIVQKNGFPASAVDTGAPRLMG